MPSACVGGFLSTIAPPLGLGSVQIADGTWVRGFIAEPRATDGATEITGFGGWRRYQATREGQAPTQ